VLAAAGARLAAKRPARGRVVLLFQPAEETGEGAAAVIADPRFASIRPDFAFAWHNLPGFPAGEVIVREGEFSSASRGLSVVLSGSTAHAAQPETGVSPARAMCDIIAKLSDPAAGGAAAGETAFATVVGARLGEKAFGTAPGRAEIWATLRSATDEAMAALVDRAEGTVRRAAERYRLGHRTAYADTFPAVVNSPRAAAMVRAAAGDAPVRTPEAPFRWSEDFGRLASVAEGALFGIGAGREGPDLHNPDYDFPEELIAPATDILMRIVGECLR
jgi:amidohydrolase